MFGWRWVPCFALVYVELFVLLCGWFSVFGDCVYLAQGCWWFDLACWGIYCGKSSGLGGVWVGVNHLGGVFLKWRVGTGRGMGRGMDEGLFVHVVGFSLSGIGGCWWG